MAISDAQLDVIIIVRRVLASITLLTSMFVVGAILLFQQHKFPHTRLVLYLSVAVGLQTFAYLQAFPRHDDALCNLQAFWISFFDWATAMWISVMALSLFLQVVRKFKDTSQFERWYHFVVWGVSLFWAIVPFFGDHIYGPAGAWCWIKEEYTDYRVATWYFPLVCFFVFVVVMYSWIIYVLRSQRRAEFYQRDSEEDEKKKMEAVIKLLRYPLVFIILWVIPLVNRLQNWISGDDLFVLTLLHTISTSIQGVVNTAIYFYDEKIIYQCTPTGVKTAFLLHFSQETREQHQVQKYEIGFEAHQPSPKNSMSAMEVVNLDEEPFDESPAPSIPTRVQLLPITTQLDE